MKPVFFESAKRWLAGRSALLALSSLIAFPFAASGAGALWYSQDYGSFFNNLNLPIIDATNFWNVGTWNIGVSPYPYKTADTLNYTNRGLMTSTVGWQFDLGPANSGTSLTLRNAAGIFFNDNTGIIESDDNWLITSSGIATYVSYLWVTATNIVNKGYLKAGSSGQILLIGTNVNLSRGFLEIVPTTGSTRGTIPQLTTKTNVTPAKGITYQIWAQTNMSFHTSELWDGTTFAVPQFTGQGLCGTNWFISWFYDAYDNYTFWTNKATGFAASTNSSGTRQDNQGNLNYCTNFINEAVFVIPPADPTITADVRYLASLNPSNKFDTVTLKLGQTITNPVTLSLQDNTLFLVDVMASSTNKGLFLSPPSSSAICSDPTFQPANYLISRSDLDLSFMGISWPYYYYGNGFAFASGLPGATGLPPSNFFYDTSWTNDNSVTTYATLDLALNSITTRPPAGTSIDHAGGRVQVYAGNLNLGRTRMSGEGWINVRCDHLVDSVGAVVDCQNLSYDLGSTNGTLVFTNLAPLTVSRFQGEILVWSATWSNLTTKTIDTYILTSTNGLIETNLPVSVMENLYVMWVDASSLGVTIPVRVLDLRLHSATNIYLGDSVVVTNSFFIDGPGLTIQKELVLANGVQNWISTNAPTLRNFINNGFVEIPNNAHFGDDRTNKYLTFINNGIMVSGGQTIDSADLEINNGINVTFNSDFSAVTQTGQLTGATVRALTVNSIITTNNTVVVTTYVPGGGAINFHANSLQIINSALSSYDAINFTVTNALFDSGPPSSGNIFSCFNGFNLWRAPTSGDLLGTVIYDIAEAQVEVDHNWAGANVGKVAAGYTGHTAIGTLVLFPASPLEPSGIEEPLFAFYGTTGGNAMYVNHLDLSYLTDFANELYIDSSLTIYFSSATHNPDVTFPGYPSFEAYLDNNPSLFGPRLQWVQGVGIPAPQAQPQPAPGQGYKLTASYDAASSSVQLKAGLLLGQTNVIQASTDLMHWIPLSTNVGSYTNIGAVIIKDSSASNYPNRFYRAKPWP